MSDSLFLITGGGTGAKVAEALVHLCAAGLGPAEVHILLVDADSTNGNLQRAAATADAYAAMQQWPWSVDTRTTSGGMFGIGSTQAQHKLSLFRSRITLHRLTEPLDSAVNGGIRSLAQHDSTRAVMDLLYDADEQQAQANDGFRARPNLGCLLLADHLEQKLESAAGGFLDALVRVAATQQAVPVVVTASIFGGTGASLLPIARGAVEAALDRRMGGGMGPNPANNALRWGAAMVLPHYQPTRRIASVDPDRYLLDTSNALQFYGLVQQSTADLYDAVYAIGSDRPSRNRVAPVLGQKDQANPPYVEEMVAGLAALHFAGTQAGARAVRVYEPEPTSDRLRWADLPLGGEEKLVEHFAYLLHLGAFFLAPSESYQGGLTKGLAGLLSSTAGADVEAFAWFDVLDEWARTVSPIYAQTPKGRRAEALQNPNVMHGQSAGDLRPHAVEYFGRLHLWATSTLLDGENGVLQLLTHQPTKDYVQLYGEMSRMASADVDAPAPGQEAFDPNADNALARLLRIALAAEVNAHEKTKVDGKVHGDFDLVEPQGDGRIGVRISPQQVRDALSRENLSGVADEYTRTAA